MQTTKNKYRSIRKIRVFPIDTYVRERMFRFGRLGSGGSLGFIYPVGAGVSSDTPGHLLSPPNSQKTKKSH